MAVRAVETALVERVHRAKVCGLLREERPGLVWEVFQEELAALGDADLPNGHPPLPPAQLALAPRLHASPGGAEDEGMEATTRDRRGPRVRDGLAGTTAPLSQATRVAVRQPGDAGGLAPAAHGPRRRPPDGPNCGSG